MSFLKKIMARQAPHWNENKVEQILKSKGPLSHSDNAELTKAMDYWEFVNNNTDDDDVLEHVTEELMRIAKRKGYAEKAAKPQQLHSSFKKRLLARYAVVASLADKVDEYVKATEGKELPGWMKPDIIKRAIQALEDGISTKEIYNVDWNDAKERISNAYQRFGKALFPSGWEYRDSGLEAPSSIIHYPNFLRKYEENGKKGKPGHKKITDEMRWWSDLAKLVIESKAFIKKGRKPDPEVEKRKAAKIYKPPKSAEKDLKMVEDVIKELLKEWYPKQVQSYFESYKHGAQSLINWYSKPEWKKEKFPMFFVPYRRYITNEPSKYDYEDKGPPTMVPDAKMKEDAERQTKATQEAFLDKQQRKLTSIVAKHGGLKEVNASNIRSGRGVIEGTLNFLFENGDKFSVLNQVVTKVSNKGTWFAQFPTTFHDIKMGDKTIKKQSEEWMNKVFAEGSNVPKEG